MILDLLKEIDKFSKLKFESFEQFVQACNQKRYAIVSESALKIIRSDGRLYMIAPTIKKETDPHKFGNVLGCEVFYVSLQQTKKIEDWYFYVTDQKIKIEE